MKNIPLLTKNILKTAGVLAATFIVHLSYLLNGFTWLDEGDIVSGRTIVDPLNFKAIFASSFGNTHFYRPLTSFIVSLNKILFGFKVFGYHLTSLIFLSLFVLVVILAGRKIFRLSRNQAFLAGLIAGIHPLTWLVTGSVSYVSELLVVTFSWLTLVFYVKSVQIKKPLSIILTVASFILALLAKETALVLVPLMIIGWELMKSKKYPALSVKDIRVGLYLNLFLTGAIYLMLRFKAVAAIWPLPESGLTFSEFWGTRLINFVRQIAELFYPLLPPLSDAVAVKPISSLPALVAAGLIVAAISWLILIRKKHPNLALAGGLVLITLLPTLNLIHLPRFSSPHYSFFALPAGSALIALFFSKIVRTAKSKAAAKILITGLLIFSAVITFRGGFRFQNNFTLFAPAVVKSPQFREGYFYLGEYYLKGGNYAKAAEYFEKSLKKERGWLAFVDENSARINLAGIYLAQNKLTEAKRLLTQALRGNYQPALQIFYNLALIELQLGNYNKVISLLKDRVNTKISPESAILLAYAYYKADNPFEAQRSLKRFFPASYQEKISRLKLILEQDAK